MNHPTRVLLFLTALLATAALPGVAQEALPTLSEINARRISINQTGMMVLTGWAVVNMAVGTAGYFKTEGSTRYFHQMNAAWNVVNAGIGLIAYMNLAGQQTSAFGLTESIAQAHAIENILLLNIGLDVAYIAAGGYLWERGLRKKSERLQGYGPSLMIQGGFLLGLDIVLYALNATNSGRLDALLRQLQFTGNQLSVHVTF